MLGFISLHLAWLCCCVLRVHSAWPNSVHFSLPALHSTFSVCFYSICLRLHSYLTASTAMCASTCALFIVTSQCYLLLNALKIFICICLEVHSSSICLQSLHSAWLDFQCTLLWGNRRTGVNSVCLLCTLINLALYLPQSALNLTLILQLLLYYSVLTPAVTQLPDVIYFQWELENDSNSRHSAVQYII